MKNIEETVVRLDKIVGGGQALGTAEDGRKIFVWGGLPDETVRIQITKKKSKYAEGTAIEVIEASSIRVVPEDPDSYLSTSPWQIMNFKSEEHFKSALIEEAFELHKIILPGPIEVYSNGNEYGYRNKVEFSWYWNKQTETLDLAFFKRGSHGKIPVDKTSLAMPSINQGAVCIRDVLRKRNNLLASDLKTLLIRANQKGEVIAQLYVKKPDFTPFDDGEIENLGNNITGFEIIYSDPLSPASVITKRLQQSGKDFLSDKIAGITFNYAVEGFFQVNLPVFEKTIDDIKKWIIPDSSVVDFYSGVGTIGLTVGGKNVTMVETDENAVREMQRNICALDKEKEITVVHSDSEDAVNFINSESLIIVDPPRNGLHETVTRKLLDEVPPRIIYLSCNPTTQARDIAMLSDKYAISFHRGYNFFPRTPHIEHLVILDKIDR